MEICLKILRHAYNNNQRKECPLRVLCFKERQLNNVSVQKRLSNLPQTLPDVLKTIVVVGGPIEKRIITKMDGNESPND